MIDRRYFRYFDWTSFVLMISLLSIGLLFVFSATYRPNHEFSICFKKQVFGVIGGLAIYFFFCLKDIRSLSRWFFWGYFLVIGLLLYTMVGGWIGFGAKRWISLYVIRFQPSELIKLCLPFFIASYFYERDYQKQQLEYKLSVKDFLFPLGVLGATFVLVLKQPDLGTALIVLFSGFILLWFIGLSRWFFITFLLLSLMSAPILWKVLKPYQQKRILVLMGYGDVRKERYQVEQSKIAIGSGGVTGKGLLCGTQNKLDFLPEDHTDFIFSVLCEELGFVGALFVIFLFASLFTRIIFVLSSITSLLEATIGVGLLAHILLSVCINLGMVTGILPIVGIPLPLISYGVTNLWITLASFGVLNNIAIRRFYY